MYTIYIPNFRRYDHRTPLFQIHQHPQRISNCDTMLRLPLMRYQKITMTKHLFKAKSLRPHRNILTHRRIFIDHNLPKIKHPHYILLSMVL